MAFLFISPQVLGYKKFLCLSVSFHCKLSQTCSRRLDRRLLLRQKSSAHWVVADVLRAAGGSADYKSIHCTQMEGSTEGIHSSCIVCWPERIAHSWNPRQETQLNHEWGKSLSLSCKTSYFINNFIHNYEHFLDFYAVSGTTTGSCVDILYL